jgi:uncharacterized membrane protein YfcA
MEISSLALVGVLSVFVGVLIGGVGIGGVLLVPMLTYLLGLDVHTAIAAAMFSYLFSGLVGALVYGRKKSIQWKAAFWLFVGAGLGAFLGAYASFVIPARGLELFIAILIVLAGANALRSSGDGRFREHPLSAGALMAIGGVTGIGSALSGTGGPLVLVPLLVFLRLPALAAVGLSQVIQVPIAASATLGNYLYGTVDVVIGAAIAAGLVVGVAGGARLAHFVSQAILQRVVAGVLVAVGLFIIGRISIFQTTV